MTKLIYGDFVAHVACIANLAPVEAAPEIEWGSILGANIKELGVDALGRYNDNGKILIDSNACNSLAEELGVTSMGLCGVVLLHEVSHWVHNTARCTFNHAWDGYGSEPSELIEELAQENTFFSVVWFHPEFLEAMKALSHQSPDYCRRWERHLRFANDQQTLLRLRAEFALNLWKMSGRGSVKATDILDVSVDE